MSENLEGLFDRIGFAPKYSALANKRQLLYDTALQLKTINMSQDSPQQWFGIHELESYI